MNNFKYIHLNTYSSEELLIDNEKKFRRVYNSTVATTIFFDLVIKNEKFGEENWVANIVVKCYKYEGNETDFKIVFEDSIIELITANELYRTFSGPCLTKYENTIESGAYLSSVEIEGNIFKSQFFFITASEKTTVYNNPYFLIESIKLFKQSDDVLLGTSKKQLNQFNKAEADYIYADVHFKNNLPNSSWFCEFYVFCFSESGELKERISYFQIIKGTDSDCLISIKFGSIEFEYWQEGNYKLQFSFHDIIVAECFFSIGDEDIEGNIFVEKDARKIAKIDEIETAKKEGLKFDKILNINEATEFPEKISDEFAVNIAYQLEIENVVSYLNNGLSVLIICDKILIEFLYPSLCRLAGKRPVLDNFNFDTKEFIRLIQNLNDGSIFIIRNFEFISDLLVGSSILFQTHNKGLPQILAFTDTSAPVKDILRGRFALSERLQGIPRDIIINSQKVSPLSYLVTREEHGLFTKFKSEELYKNVSGLNVIQFRNAIKYLRTIFREATEPNKIYEALRVFKLHSSTNNIELPDTTFDDIGGYEDLKKYIKTALSLFKSGEKNLEKNLQKDLTPKGFVFFGPPGTGKTMLAKAIANHLNATIQMISGPEIVEMWVGKTEENLRQIFATARRNAPSVILFDEFDSIANKRSNSPTGSAMVANSLMAQLLTELDGFKKNDGVLVIGTTNRIESLDPALMRPSRLLPLFVDKPDLGARKKVAQVHARKFGIERIILQNVQLAIEHFDDWKKSASGINERQIPEKFLTSIYEINPSFKKRNDDDNMKSEISEEMLSFFSFFDGLDGTAIQDDSTRELFNSIAERLDDLNQKFREDFFKSETYNESGNNQQNLTKEFDDIYLLLNSELENSDDFLQNKYFEFLIDMIAEFTEDFNNDEIGSLFKDAIIAYSLEGRSLSPKYFGEKIGLIKTMKETKTMTAIFLRR